MGGQKKFVDKLQMVFDKGYYDMANEPDIAYPYLFSYFKGEAWRTQKLVCELLGKYYHNAPNGLPGYDVYLGDLLDDGILSGLSR